MNNEQLTLLHVVGGGHIGYGRMGIYIAKELRKSGVTVYDSIGDAPGQPTLAGQALEVWGERTPGMTNVVAWASVPTHARGWWQGQVPIILTMWEATVLPEAFRENLHEFDTVIVPSMQNVELFSKFHPNVKYLPLGVDPEKWHYVERRAPLTRFNFLISGSGPRKGTDLAVKAFRLAFPEGSWGMGPTPYLQMKQHKPEDFYGKRIELISGRLTGEDERDLYANAHVYVQPSRGEGFGLQPLQAMAQGLPTILTDAHGHAAFAHYGRGLSTTMSQSAYFIYGDAGDWWEPDLDELVDTMRWMYDHYDEEAERARVNSPLVIEEFNWAKTANGFADLIGRDRLGPYMGNHEWYTPEVRLFPVVTRVPHQADIGGLIYIFEEGVEQYVPADVKRILFDGGKLDPVCLTGEDTGLSKAQLLKLPTYSDIHAYCPTCYQKLGSGVTKKDEILNGARKDDWQHQLEDFAHAQ